MLMIYLTMTMAVYVMLVVNFINMLHKYQSVVKIVKSELK